jgi:D-serine deaminase-like pyridoxal phosphate-dependent protein
MARLVELNARLRQFAVVTESVEHVTELAQAAEAAEQVLDVLVVCDVGAHRFGVTSPQAALEVAQEIARRPSLRFKGIQGYAGSVQHIPGYAERRAASLEAVAKLGRVRDALRAAGFEVGIVTGSGTGTHDIDPEAGVFTDLQVGSYIFCDADYDRCQLTADGSRRFRNSLFVATRVVSNRHAEFVTTDAGSKCFALDGPPPPVAWGAPEGSTYRMFGDQFGRVDLPAGSNGLPLGTLLACIVPHCDPTVNLYDHYHCVRGDTLVEIWPIEARGRTA